MQNHVKAYTKTCVITCSFSICLVSLLRCCTSFSCFHFYWLYLPLVCMAFKIAKEKVTTKKLLCKLVRMHQETAMSAIAKHNILRMDYKHQCSSDTYTHPQSCH